MSFTGNELLAGLGTLVSLCGSGVWIYGFFQIRASLLNYYNTVENIGLKLSPIMTFFFGVFYFQHHFTRIADWKDGKPLVPQTYHG
jgi:drug/metabolite transporter (DMT)-like permease